MFTQNILPCVFILLLKSQAIILKCRAISDLFFFFCLFQYSWKSIKLQMIKLEPQISGLLSVPRPLPKSTYYLIEKACKIIYDSIPNRYDNLNGLVQPVWPDFAIWFHFG